MITIIKHGNYVKKCTCADCECEFLFEEEDVYISAEDNVECIRCPECKEELIID